MWPCKRPLRLSFNPGEVPPTVHQLCASEVHSSLPASSCPQVEFDGRNRMMSDVYGYNLIVSYAGEGGRYFQVEGEEAFALLPPSPSRRRFAHSNPQKEGGSAGPLSIMLARSPGGWGECGCSDATRSLPQFGSPGVWEGGLSIRFPFPPPSVARCCCSDTPVLLDSGGSPSLRWTKDMKQHSVHTQAVQPSYSWARLSMLVASLITKSTWK